MGWRQWAEGGYVGVVTVLAVLGAVRADPHYYVAAIVLALPCSIVSVVAIYAGYALLSAVGGLFASRTVADGDEPGWLTVGSGTVNVVVLAVAAAVNVYLLRRIWRARP